MSASARRPTSPAARFRPLAPVGGTIWAASPARKRRPNRRGSATKLLRGAMDFSMDWPVINLSAQLVPEAVIGPFLYLLVERHLHIVPAAGRRAHGAEGEAPGVMGVDQ